MVPAKRFEQRTDERDARFSNEFSLRLIPNDNDGKVIPIRPIDVSRRGLGFLVRESLKSGGFYTLVVGKFKFRVELAYCNSHLGIDNLYRCGLFLREADGNLHDACDRSGLLSDQNKSYH
jgi:hypothetical protein